MTEPNGFNVFPLLIAIILVLVAKQLYDLYRKFTIRHHHVYFVMMGETECCNPNNPNDADPNKKCKKYCMGRLLKEIMDRINSAKTSMCIAMYNFSNHRLADCVLRAHRRGVKVRLVIDRSASESTESKTQAKRLKDAGMFKINTKIFEAKKTLNS